MFYRNNNPFYPTPPIEIQRRRQKKEKGERRKEKVCSGSLSECQPDKLFWRGCSSGQEAVGSSLKSKVGRQRKKTPEEWHVYRNKGKPLFTPHHRLKYKGEGKKRRKEKGERRKFAAAACPNASPTSYSGGDVHPGRRQ